MRKVYASDNHAIIGLVRQVIEDDAIPCVVRNDFLGGGAGDLPINETWPEIWVIEDRDFDRARALVDAVLATDHPDESAWRCASCDEPMEGQFTNCWRCGVARPRSDC